MPKKKALGSHLSFRLNILFFIIFILFSVLILRLGFMQIVQGETYLEDAERNRTQTVEYSSPRGWIMDRNGEVLVQNEPDYIVTYTKYNGEEQGDQVAQQLANLLDDVEVSALQGKIENSEALQPIELKSGLSQQEIARIAEHQHQLSGIEIIHSDDRAYPHGNVFRYFLGSARPIPSERQAEFLAKGYRLNERVGLGRLEEQYEDQLRGTDRTREVVLDRRWQPVGEPTLNHGQRGNDLVLTIDLELQKTIEDVINEQIENNPAVDEAYFVAMDPFTGEILGMTDHPNVIGVGGTAFAPGSTVKMASVLIGLHEGIFRPYDQVYDTTMRFADGSEISSWQNLGTVNAYQAIEQSSNIYMAQVGLRLGGSSGPDWRMTTGQTMRTFDQVRQYFAQFGLGVKTGIDLPEERPGQLWESPNHGDLAQYMFGQHDNYTPLQLAQFVSTIANGGYRMQPHLVREIRQGISEDGSSGALLWKKEPSVLNRIDMSDEHIRVVQQGMEMVTDPSPNSQGTARTVFEDFPVTVAAKTGTAQSGPGRDHHTLLVGYAPADHPQIAFATVVPESQSSRTQGVTAPAQVISRDILEVYFGGSLETENDADDDEAGNDEEDAF